MTSHVPTIEYKSTPDNWNKECLGLKRNTIRKNDHDSDTRFVLLGEWMSAKIQHLDIRIVNTDPVGTDDVFFTRRVTDVTVFEDLYIISW